VDLAYSKGNPGKINEKISDSGYLLELETE
jgi:hypothetical protein